MTKEQSDLILTLVFPKIESRVVEIWQNVWLRSSQAAISRFWTGALLSLPPPHEYHLNDSRRCWALVEQV